MTVQAQVSVNSQVFVPRDYDVFAGLDVDHHSIAATFRRSCSTMSGSIFPRSGWPLFTKLDQRALAFMMSWWPRAIRV